MSNRQESKRWVGKTLLSLVLGLVSACSTSPEGFLGTEPSQAPAQLSTPAAISRSGGSGEASLRTDHVSALSNTTQQTLWFYFRDPGTGFWYIVDRSGFIFMLDAVGPQYSGNIGWRPINAPNGGRLSFGGYPDAGTSFSSVSVSSNGETVNIGGATWNGLHPAIAAIQGSSQTVRWVYFQNKPTGWYIADASATQVMFLDAADPAIQGGLGWQPVYQSSYLNYPDAGKTFQSVSLGSGKNSTVFGAAAGTSGSTFRLTVFPLPNRTAYSAVINSVFDHSMTATHAVDGVVTAYTGESGLSQFGAGLYATDVQGFGNLVITGVFQDVLGYMGSQGKPFVVNGHYSGGLYLYYEGHEGFDYRTNDQASNGRINVMAAAAGTVTLIQGSAFNTIKIDHGNGYTTHYLHLHQRLVGDGAQVQAGQVVGISGSTGATAPHLHFEVRLNGIPVDPYGWSGSGSDPYKAAKNRLLW